MCLELDKQVINMKLQLKHSENLLKQLNKFKEYNYELVVYDKKNYIYLSTNSRVVLSTIKREDVLPNEYNIKSLLANLSITGKYLIPVY